MLTEVNPSSLSGIVSHIERRRFQADVACNARDCLATLQRHFPDILITDVDLVAGESGNRSELHARHGSATQSFHDSDQSKIPRRATAICRRLSIEQAV